jgi:starch phosphorylase
MNDYYLAVANTVRDRMQYLFVNSVEALLDEETRWFAACPPNF